MCNELANIIGRGSKSQCATGRDLKVNVSSIVSIMILVGNSFSSNGVFKTKTKQLGNGVSFVHKTCCPLDILEIADTLWRINVPEKIEFIEGSKGHEYEIPNQQDCPKLFIEPPVVEMKSPHEEDDCGKETKSGVDHSFALDSNKPTWIHHGGGNEPRKSQTHQNVKHVAANSVGNRHVTMT